MESTVVIRATQALGRLAPGTMNKTEAAYAAFLEQRRIAGEVAWWKFEALTLKLALGTRLTPDFFVMLADGSLEAHDTKGSLHVYTDDAKVKMKVAASLFPFRFFVAIPRARKAGGGWDISEVAA